MPAECLPWERIARSSMHPLAVRILELVSQAPPDGLPGWSPKMMVAEFDVPMGNVTYHVRALSEAGLLVLVDEVKVRGAVEHFYALAGEAALAAGEQRP